MPGAVIRRAKAKVKATASKRTPPPQEIPSRAKKPVKPLRRSAPGEVPAVRANNARHRLPLRGWGTELLALDEDNDVGGRLNPRGPRKLRAEAEDP